MLRNTLDIQSLKVCSYYRRVIKLIKACFQYIDTVHKVNLLPIKLLKDVFC